MDNVEMLLASSTYTHDQEFFERMGLKNTPALDFAHRAHSSGIRRTLKFIEYLLNMVLLEVGFLKEKPDVIHVQFTPLMEHHLPFELWFLKIARRLGIKLIYTVHNVLPHEESERLRFAYAELYSIMDHFICHDGATKDRLTGEFGIESNRVSVIAHGALFTGASASRNCLPIVSDLAPGTRVVLWQGIIREYKGVSFLLRAWKEAQQAGLNAILFIVGTGEDDEIQSIKEQVRTLGIESSVRLDLRFVSLEELAAYYEAADVVVYPYSAITTSGALMTGIGYGKAVIASDLPAFRQTLRHERNALLIPHDDLNGWANALSLLISNDELRIRLAQRLSEDRAQLPDWDAIARETVRAYTTL
jgi:glycosyltransferase involved in cell wall biosynthesis